MANLAFDLLDLLGGRVAYRSGHVPRGIVGFVLQVLGRELLTESPQIIGDGRTRDFDVTLDPLRLFAWLSFSVDAWIDSHRSASLIS